LLSYIPFKQEVVTSGDTLMSPVRLTRQSSTDSGMCEGMRQNTMSKDQRELEQREIKKFVAQAFQEVSRFTVDQYLEFNSHISSEMFVSVMSILQERLPCASYYFRQRRKFKQSLQLESASGLSISTGQNSLQLPT